MLNTSSTPATGDSDNIETPAATSKEKLRTVSEDSAMETLAPFLNILEMVNEFFHHSPPADEESGPTPHSDRWSQQAAAARAAYYDRRGVKSRRPGRVTITNLDLYEETPYPHDEQRMCKSRPDRYLSAEKCQAMFDEVGYRFHYQQNSWKRCWDFSADHIKKKFAEQRKRTEALVDASTTPFEHRSDHSVASGDPSTAATRHGQEKKIDGNAGTNGTSSDDRMYDAGNSTSRPPSHLRSFDKFFHNFYQFVMKVRPDTFFFPRTRVLREEKLEPRVSLSTTPIEAKRWLHLDKIHDRGIRGGFEKQKKDEVEKTSTASASGRHSSTPQLGEGDRTDGNSGDPRRAAVLPPDDFVGAHHGYAALSHSQTEIDYLNEPDAWLLQAVLDEVSKRADTTGTQGREQGPTEAGSIIPAPVSQGHDSSSLSTDAAGEGDEAGVLLQAPPSKGNSGGLLGAFSSWWSTTSSTTAREGHDESASSTSANMLSAPSSASNKAEQEVEVHAHQVVMQETEKKDKDTRTGVLEASSKKAAAAARRESDPMVGTNQHHGSSSSAAAASEFFVAKFREDVDRDRFLFFRDLWNDERYKDSDFLPLLEDTLLKHGGDAVLLFKWGTNVAQFILRGMVSKFAKWWETTLGSQHVTSYLSHHCRLGFVMRSAAAPDRQDSDSAGGEAGTTDSHQKNLAKLADVAFGSDVMATDYTPAPVNMTTQQLASPGHLQQHLLDCHHSHQGAILPPWFRQSIYEPDVFYPEGRTITNSTFMFDLFQFRTMLRRVGLPQRWPAFEEERLQLTDERKLQQTVAELKRVFRAAGLGVLLPDGKLDTDPLRVWDRGLITGTWHKEFRKWLPLHAATLERLEEQLQAQGPPNPPEFLTYKLGVHLRDIITEDTALATMYQTESKFVYSSRHYVHVHSVAQCDFYCHAYYSCMGFVVVVTKNARLSKPEQVWDPRRYYASLKGKEARDLNYTTRLYDRMRQIGKIHNPEQLHGQQFDQKWVDIADDSAMAQEILDRDEELVRKLLLYPQTATGLRCFLKADTPKALGASRMWDVRFDLQSKEFAPKIVDSWPQEDQRPWTPELGRKLGPKMFKRTTGAAARVSTNGKKRQKKEAREEDGEIGRWQDLQKEVEENYNARRAGAASDSEALERDHAAISTPVLTTRRRYYFSGLKLVNVEPFNYVYLPISQVHTTFITSKVHAFLPGKRLVLFDPCYRARAQTPFTPSYIGNVTVPVYDKRGKVVSQVVLQECFTVSALRQRGSL
ncbi:unnamed protein product [Amoebophrya sp. A120]|nr:unnamed protein product [Amoebophrya sp. A120]|eukprot:GSA120T00014998001.1